MILGMIVLLALIYILWEVWKETHKFVVTHYEINTPKMDSSRMRVAFLSDLHGKIYGKDNEDLIRAVENEKPDFILIGGDMLIANHSDSVETAKQLIEKLVEIAPVYYADGNHEQRTRACVEQSGTLYEDYYESLKSMGVEWLINDSRSIIWKGNKIQLTGADVPRECFKRFVGKEFTLKELKEEVGESAENAYQILLVHHPKFVEMYKEWGADLILSGHLHGGVARLPIFGGVGVISPQISLFPKYSGDCYSLGEDRNIVVSKGLGTHTINIRFWNPAELIILDIIGES